jgi:hypothetical protein
MRSSAASQTIYNAVVDLNNTSRRAHRETIAEITGLKLSIVDDHLKRLKADGRLQLIERGVYIPIPPSREDRAVSNTMLPGGTCKVEIGDEVLSLTMREARMVVSVLGGITLSFVAAGGSR